LIEVGDRVILSRVDYVGGTRTDVPVFGAWGLRKGKGMDHSVIALGRVGNDRVYILQKMSPMNPYYINVRHIVDFEWYQIPPTPTCSYEPGGRKSP